MRFQFYTKNYIFLENYFHNRPKHINSLFKSITNNLYYSRILFANPHSEIVPIIPPHTSLQYVKKVLQFVNF